MIRPASRDKRNPAVSSMKCKQKSSCREEYSISSGQKDRMPELIFTQYSSGGSYSQFARKRSFARARKPGHKHNHKKRNRKGFTAEGVNFEGSKLEVY